MTFRRISRREMLSSCSDLGPEDGRDPRLEHRAREGGKVANRKARQLCGQVERTLAGVFAECGDEVLRELVLESVAPAPNSARLLVTVSLRPPADAERVRRAAEHLERARGLLRSETAGAIHRRRAPDLMFRVVDPL